MFRCEAGHTSKPGERMIKTVVETRVRPSDGGWEIVREARLCPEHAMELQRRADLDLVASNMIDILAATRPQSILH